MLSNSNFNGTNRKNDQSLCNRRILRDIAVIWVVSHVPDEHACFGIVSSLCLNIH